MTSLVSAFDSASRGQRHIYEIAESAMRSTRSHWDKLPPDVSQSVFGLLWPPPECALLPRSSPSVAVVPASGASNRIRMGSGLQRPSPRVNFLQDVALARLVCRNWAKQVAGAAPWLFPRPWEAPPAGWQQKFSGLRHGPPPLQLVITFASIQSATPLPAIRPPAFP